MGQTEYRKVNRTIKIQNVIGEFKYGFSFTQRAMAKINSYVENLYYTIYSCRVSLSSEFQRSGIRASLAHPCVYR